MLERDMRLVQLSGGRYHAALVTCRESLEVIRRAKQAGLNVTAGVSINHLTLNELDIGQYRTFLRLRPPLRAEEDRLAMVEAVSQGLIDVIVSDHNPQDVETKRLTFAECAPGAIGLETMLAAGMRLVEAGQIGLKRLLEAMSEAPSRLLGLETGRMAKGAPADLVVVDPEEPWIVDAAALRSRCKNTPFDEARMTGRVRLTMVAGRIVFRAD
jgi:dihydroorotase